VQASEKILPSAKEGGSPEGCIRPAGKWAGGRNGPVDLLPSEEKAMA